MSILIVCPHCSASRSDEPGCISCALERLSARSGVGGFTADELELFRLRDEVARLRQLSDALSFTLLFRTPRGLA